MEAKKPENIDEYIGAFPNDVQEILEKVRMTIQKSRARCERKNQLFDACF